MLSSSFFCSVLTSLLSFWSCFAAAENPAIYFTLHRRGDRFVRHETANLTYFAEELAEVELKYAKAERIVEGNRLGRQWKSKRTGTTIDDELITSVGVDGRWQASMESNFHTYY